MTTVFTEMRALERVLHEQGYTNDVVVLVIETAELVRQREFPSFLEDPFVLRALSAIDAETARLEVERAVRRTTWLRSRAKVPRPPMVERRRARVCALSCRYRAYP